MLQQWWQLDSMSEIIKRKIPIFNTVIETCYVIYQNWQVGAAVAICDEITMRDSHTQQK